MVHTTKSYVRYNECVDKEVPVIDQGDRNDYYSRARVSSLGHRALSSVSSSTSTGRLQQGVTFERIISNLLSAECSLGIQHTVSGGLFKCELDGFSRNEKTVQKFCRSF